MFEDQDTETDGVQNTMTTREVEENTKAIATDDDTIDSTDPSDNVGGVVMATDPGPQRRPVDLHAGGDRCVQVQGAGQWSDRGGSRDEGWTTRPSGTYMVTVMAEDSFGDSASIMVTITVTDLNEGPDINRRDTVEYPENRTSSVETYRASDPERAGHNLVADWRRCRSLRHQ